MFCGIELVHLVFVVFLIMEINRFYFGGKWPYLAALIATIASAILTAFAKVDKRFQPFGAIHVTVLILVVGLGMITTSYLLLLLRFGPEPGVVVYQTSEIDDRGFMRGERVVLTGRKKVSYCAIPIVVFVLLALNCTWVIS